MFDLINCFEKKLFLNKVLFFIKGGISKCLICKNSLSSVLGLKIKVYRNLVYLLFLIIFLYDFYENDYKVKIDKRKILK